MLGIIASYAFLHEMLSVAMTRYSTLDSKRYRILSISTTFLYLVKVDPFLAVWPTGR